MNSKLTNVEQKHGNLHDVIPKLVNEKGQVGAAHELGVSASTINKWLRDNGYRMRITYFNPRLEVSEAGHAALLEAEAS